MSVENSVCGGQTPEPCSDAELRRFATLQTALRPIYEDTFPHFDKPRTVLVVPSLSLDSRELKKIVGVAHYEERMLCMLMLLRLPRTKVIYATSTAVDPAVIDYFLSLLPGIPVAHARKRLKLICCANDSIHETLSEKLLRRNDLLQQLQDELSGNGPAHMNCFNATAAERSLSVRLGIPLYACDPALLELGGKSGSRKIFRQAGIDTPDGFEDLASVDALAEAVSELKQRNPKLLHAVVKLNEGFSGEGNALFPFGDAGAGDVSKQWVLKRLPKILRFEAAHEQWETFSAKFEEMSGIVECFLTGDEVRSPSMQGRINPVQDVKVISTHDQVLGGPSKQVFLGCTFPASAEYRSQIQDAGGRVGEVLRDEGALGRFGVDFISIKEQDLWKHYAIEINLRKGGTTHPNMMLEFLTDGTFEPERGVYLTPSEQERCYYSTDNEVLQELVGLTPEELIDVAVCNRIHFSQASQTGVMFHLLGALKEHGKFGLCCIAPTILESTALYNRTVTLLATQAKQRLDATRCR